MDLARFYRAIDVIDSKVKAIGIQTQLEQLIQDLSNIASSPGNVDFSTTFKDHVDQLRDGLLNSELEAFDEDVSQVLINLKLGQFVGEGLLQRILSTFQTNQLSANLASTALTDLKNEVVKKLNLVATINKAFSDLAIEYFHYEENEGEMLIDLPVEDETKSLEDLSKEAKEWHRICDAISENFDTARTPVTIRTLASGSWLLYLAGSPAFIYGIAKCMKGVNVILAELIRMKALYAELAASKAPQEILKKLDAHNSSKVKTDLDELATSLVKEFYKGADKGRSNELRNALSAALQRLSRKLAEGAKVQLRLTLPKEPVIADGQDATPEQKKQQTEVAEAKKIQQEIEQAKPLLDYEKYQVELQKALPAPIPDQIPDSKSEK